MPTSRRGDQLHNTPLHTWPAGGQYSEYRPCDSEANATAPRSLHSWRRMQSLGSSTRAAPGALPLLRKPVQRLHLALCRVQPVEALVRGIQQPVPSSESAEAVSQDNRQDLVRRVLQKGRPAVAHFKQIASPPNQVRVGFALRSGTAFMHLKSAFPVLPRSRLDGPPTHRSQS